MVNLTELDRRYTELLAAFEAIAQTRSSVQRRAQLNWIAPYYDLPRAETRALFRLWLLEKVSGGAE